MRVAKRLQERALHHELRSEAAREELRKRVHGVRAGVKAARSGIERTAEEEPFKFLGYAALAGAAAGILLSRATAE